MNKKSDNRGDHEVHVEGCAHMPGFQNQLFLGEFSHCIGAVAKAKRVEITADGCYHCCNNCHTS